MLPGVSELHIALAVAPVAGVLAIQGLRFRRRLQDDIRSREERVEHARREATQAMKAALAASQAAERAREEFLSRMSHELRTPLNAVIGFSRVLENNKAGNQRPEDIQLLSRVRASGEHLLHMLQDVLDQSRIESGELSLKCEGTNVIEVTQRAISDYQKSFELKGLKLTTVLPDSAPMVQLDAGRLEQVVSQLLDNALKFTPRGEVSVVLVTDAATLRPSRLIVADTGVGIPADRIEKVFDSFEQAETGTARPYVGMGLGLRLARTLCAAMRCGLTVESTAGQGSRFTIRFPDSQPAMQDLLPAPLLPQS